MKVDTHPIPKIKELFTAMHGGVSFTLLDLSHAHLQLHFDESAKGSSFVVGTGLGLQNSEGPHIV